MWRILREGVSQQAVASVSTAGVSHYKPAILACNCTACSPAVFGWFADSFAGVESDTDYELDVNYQKRPPSLTQFLSFDIVVINQNSAGK